MKETTKMMCQALMLNKRRCQQQCSNQQELFFHLLTLSNNFLAIIHSIQTDKDLFEHEIMHDMAVKVFETPSKNFCKKCSCLDPIDRRMKARRRDVVNLVVRLAWPRRGPHFSFAQSPSFNFLFRR